MAKPIGTVFPKLHLKYIGENAIFQCVSHGTTKWIKDGKEIAPAYPSAYQNPSILIIRYVHPYNTGFYTCLGMYEDGSQFEAKSKLVVASKSYEGNT